MVFFEALSENIEKFNISDIQATYTDILYEQLLSVNRTFQRVICNCLVQIMVNQYVGMSKVKMVTLA